MKLALDTNRYVDFCRGDPDAVQKIRSASIIGMPAIVLGELRAGFVAGSQAQRNEKGLVQFLNSPRVQILSPDEQTSHHYAALYKQLRDQGTPIPTNDLWIAALVLQHGMILHARDKHFDHLPQLARI